MMEKFLSPLSHMSDNANPRRSAVGASANGVQSQYPSAAADHEQTAVEVSKKSFLQAWSDYIETVKKNTEISERWEGISAARVTAPG